MANERGAFKRIFFSICCWLYALADTSWAPFVKDERALFVRFVNVFKNPCGYCTAARMLFVGAGGMALLLQSWLLAFLLLGLPITLVVIERVASCEEPKPEPEPEPVEPQKHEGT